MTYIATLGPPGTFSDIVAKNFLETLSDGATVRYYGSIKNVLKSIGSECEYGVVPIENLSEGFIPIVLDFLVTSELQIIKEIIIPINFSFVAKLNDSAEISKIFVQFAAKGQCSEFVESIGEDIEIITTESNIESIERMLHNQENSGAVVPVHFVRYKDYPIFVQNINDFPNNQTRFFVVAAKYSICSVCSSAEYKTSVIIINDNDRPGLLENILSSFSQRKVNLFAITSRPTKEAFGKYHFFIGLSGHQNDTAIKDSLAEIKKIARVKILGSYEKAMIV